MLKIYDSDNNALGYITKYKDLEIESELSTGDKTLSFSYLEQKMKDIQNEYYIETQTDRYVVKETGVSTDGFLQFQCQLDLEDLERDVFEIFSASQHSLTDAANMALAGTGWTVDTDIVKKRSVATMKATPLEVLGKIRDAWMCEMQFDTKEKTVRFREQIGEDKGVFFITDLNLRKMDLTVDTYDYYTRLIPIGKDNLRIDAINENRPYVENYQYTSKIRTMIWEDSSYTDAEALKEDAEKKLEDLSKPKKSYSADILNLAAVKPEYSILSFQLGDTIMLMDERTGVKDRQRIVKLTEYPQEPVKNKCELSNTTLTFEEYQSKLEAAANAVENITNADGTVNGVIVKGVEADGIVGIETVIAESDVVKKIGENTVKASKNAKEAYQKATETDETVDGWSCKEDSDYIDGGKIYKKTISAKQIDVEDLFTQNITATGTITGITLKGATGSFTDIRVKNALKVFKETDEGEVEAEAISMGIDENGNSIIFVGSNNTETIVLYANNAVNLMQGVPFWAETIRCKELSASYQLSEGGVALPDKYVQPYKSGDSFYTVFAGGGYVTNSKTEVWFTVPLSKPHNASSAVITPATNGGLVIRQDGKYTHGSSASGFISPSSYTATLFENAVRIKATFEDTTNAVNNDACGVVASIRITFE